MERLTDEMLARLKKLDEDATAPPWEAYDPCDSFCGDPYCSPDGCQENHPSGEYEIDGPPQADECGKARFKRKEDADLVAEGRNTLPLLIAEVEHLREQVRKYREDLIQETAEHACTLVMIDALRSGLPGTSWRELADEERLDYLRRAEAIMDKEG